MAKTYFWVCADVRKYDKGMRRNSLRTARKAARQHLKTTHSTNGWSEIVIETPTEVKYVGTVRAIKENNTVRYTYTETFDPKLRMKARMWYLNSDGTVGKLIRG